MQNGASTLAEAFLFFVGASLVLGESYRSSRKDTKRRDDVKERLEALESEIGTLKDDTPLQEQIAELRQR